MKRIVLIYLFLVCSFSLFANDIDAEVVLNKMRELTNYDTLSMSGIISTTDAFGELRTSFDLYENDLKNFYLEITSGTENGQKVLRLQKDIFVYYPDAEEVIRLSNTSKRNSFLGSSFAYEDMVSNQGGIEAYNPLSCTTEIVDEVEYYKIEMQAKESSETYQYQTLYIPVETNLINKIELFSKSKRHLKTITYSSYRKIGNVLFPFKVSIKDEIKKSVNSFMEVEEVRLNDKLNPRIFNKENLLW